MEKRDRFFRVMGQYHIEKKLFFTFLYMGLIFVLYVTGVRCFFLEITGLMCPGCGMTRACLMLLEGDVCGAFHMNPLFVTLPVIYLYILFDGRLFKNVYINYIVIGAVLLSFIILFIIRNFT